MNTEYTLESILAAEKFDRRLIECTDKSIQISKTTSGKYVIEYEFNTETHYVLFDIRDKKLYVFDKIVNTLLSYDILTDNHLKLSKSIHKIIAGDIPKWCKNKIILDESKSISYYLYLKLLSFSVINRIVYVQPEPLRVM